MVYSLVIVGVICFYLGYLVSTLIKARIEKSKIKKYNDEINKVFSDVLENITLGKTKFINRVNNTVNISTTIGFYGKINIVYLLDKKDIAIFSSNKYSLFIR